jgi:hypothetical protein
MKVIDEISDKGGKMLYSILCGGLVAPESDTIVGIINSIWAPRNVVLAGQGDS